MPADYVMITGDMLQITMTPPALVPMLIAPIPLMGSSTTLKIMSMAACLQGDELPKAISNPMPYMAPPFAVPGMGSVQIILMPTNLSIATKNDGMPLLLKGTTFQVLFQVSMPAQMPPPVSTPDPVVVKPGTAQFITMNMMVKAG